MSCCVLHLAADVLPGHVGHHEAVGSHLRPKTGQDDADRFKMVGPTKWNGTLPFESVDISVEKDRFLVQRRLARLVRRVKVSRAHVSGARGEGLAVGVAAGAAVADAGVVLAHKCRMEGEVGQGEGHPRLVEVHVALHDVTVGTDRHEALEIHEGVRLFETVGLNLVEKDGAASLLVLQFYRVEREPLRFSRSLASS